MTTRKPLINVTAEVVKGLKRGMRIHELAKRTGRPVKTVEAIVSRLERQGRVPGKESQA